MKRFLVLSAIFTLLSVGAFGCQKKAAETTPAVTEKAAVEDTSSDTDTATQKASITVKEAK